MRRAPSLVVMILMPVLLCAQEELARPTAVPPSSGNPSAAEAKTAPNARPKIGVALEGGGALGLAHVGVLKWFEEHHIPVDYVAGTSMGGLVGGLYATGMSGSEIQDFVENINWNRSFRNELPYGARSFRRKEDKQEYPNDLEFGLKGGIAFPSGFNSGHQVGLILDRIALPYSNLKTFDELPTP